MATIWIHRLCAADILVDFSSIVAAYDFAIKAARSGGHTDYHIDTMLSEIFSKPLSINSPPIVANPIMQYMIIPFGTTPDPTSSQSGFVNVLPEEALALGEEAEPEGFVPYESEGVWMKETRTLEELDEELNNYMADWRDITAAAGLKMDALSIQ